jgi:hypothetical protein
MKKSKEVKIKEVKEVKVKDIPKEIPKEPQRDTIILRFKVKSDIKDVKQTMEKSGKVADFLKAFKEFELEQVGVEYIWNESQKVAQTKEFEENQRLNEISKKSKEVSKLIKEEIKEEPKATTMEDIASDFYTQDTWKSIKNGKVAKK